MTLPVNSTNGSSSISASRTRRRPASQPVPGVRDQDQALLPRPEPRESALECPVRGHESEVEFAAGHRGDEVGHLAVPDVDLDPRVRPAERPQLTR
ncbi:hypothetical protein GCM10029964_076670 [Kibdelosporangium lantanae]